MLLMKQGEQGWLLTTDSGNHEFARLFWSKDPHREEDARYRVGAGGAPKLGRYELLNVDVNDRRALLTWTDGRQSSIPTEWFQMSWST